MSATDAIRNEFLTDVADAAERTARSHGIDPAVAEQIGAAVPRVPAMAVRQRLIQPLFCQLVEGAR